MIAPADSLVDLPNRYPHFFQVARKRRQQQPFAHVYFASLDAEWVRRYERNHLLSFQIATCSSEKACNELYIVSEGQRPTMEEIAFKAIAAVNGGIIPASHHRQSVLICLASHNTIAEYSILDDRDKPAITDAISTVRGSVITLTDSIKLTLPGDCFVEIKWFDSMLLAPAGYRGLKKLSSLLGGESEMKETISQYHIENMDVFLKTDPEGFRRYALKDTAVTLKLFFLLQQSLNELAFRNRFKKLFITIASAAVASFIEENSWHKEYLKQLKSLKFADAIRLVRRGYYGGRNEGFLRGMTSKFESTKNKVWVDIDLKGAYPTSAACLPRIDPDGPVRLLPPRYQIDPTAADRLRRDNVPDAVIEQARAALAISPRQFEIELRSMKPTIAERIRQAALICDNTLIDEWYAAWRAAKDQPGSELEHCIVPGIARVRFNFENNGVVPLYPCLLVHHPKYGLIFPVAGETTVTHMELMIALDAGAIIEAITSLELPVLRDDAGRPIYYLRDYLARLAKKRAEYDEMDATANPSAPVFEKLLKEFMNSLYGKFSQAVNPRNNCDISTFIMQRQSPSRISDPIVAALTTGATRAVLSSLLLAIERFNAGKPPESWVDVASCTTDGALVGLPTGAGTTVLGKGYYILKEIVHETGLSGS